MKPCTLDHNGECLICDCWLSDCQYDRLVSGNYESKEEFDSLMEMFKNHLTDAEKAGLSSHRKEYG